MMVGRQFDGSTWAGGLEAETYVSGSRGAVHQSLQSAAHHQESVNMQSAQQRSTSTDL
jgi:hypothetical protein